MESGPGYFSYPHLLPVREVAGLSQSNHPAPQYVTRNSGPAPLHSRRRRGKAIAARDQDSRFECKMQWGPPVLTPGVRVRAVLDQYPRNLQLSIF